MLKLYAYRFSSPVFCNGDVFLESSLVFCNRDVFLEAKVNLKATHIVILHLSKLVSKKCQSENIHIVILHSWELLSKNSPKSVHRPLTPRKMNPIEVFHVAKPSNGFCRCRTEG